MQQGEITRAKISMRRAECCRYVGENEIVESDDHPMHETTLQQFVPTQAGSLGVQQPRM